MYTFGQVYLWYSTCISSHYKLPHITAYWIYTPLGHGLLVNRVNPPSDLNRWFIYLWWALYIRNDLRRKCRPGCMLRLICWKLCDIYIQCVNYMYNTHNIYSIMSLWHPEVCTCTRPSSAISSAVPDPSAGDGAERRPSDTSIRKTASFSEPYFSLHDFSVWPTNALSDGPGTAEVSEGLVWLHPLQRDRGQRWTWQLFRLQNLLNWPHLLMDCLPSNCIRQSA